MVAAGRRFSPEKMAELEAWEDEHLGVAQRLHRARRDLPHAATCSAAW